MNENTSRARTERQRAPSFRRFLSWCHFGAVMAAFKGIWTKDFWRAVCAEFLSTLVFVLLGVGSTINWHAGEEKPPPADLVLISLCFGLSIATMVQSFGHISGGHINPAVTAAMVVTHKLSLAKALFYVAAQCLGAVTGAGLLHIVTPPSLRGSLGVTTVNSDISLGHGFLVELLITFQLVFAVFATCDPKRSDLGGSPGLAIGLAVAIGHLFAIPYTGASMNPARSFGPAMVTLNFQDHWVYWVGPVLGAIMAAGLYEYLFCPDGEAKKKSLKQVFKKDPSGKYREVDSEDATLAVKPGAAVHDDPEKGEKKPAFHREPPGEVLSSV